MGTFLLIQDPQYLWEPGRNQNLIKLYHMGISSMNDAISLVIKLYYFLIWQSHHPPQTRTRRLSLTPHTLSGERAKGPPGKETVEKQNV